MHFPLRLLQKKLQEDSGSKCPMCRVCVLFLKRASSKRPCLVNLLLSHTMSLDEDRHILDRIVADARARIIECEVKLKAGHPRAAEITKTIARRKQQMAQALADIAAMPPKALFGVRSRFYNTSMHPDNPENRVLVTVAVAAYDPPAKDDTRMLFADHAFRIWLQRNASYAEWPDHPRELYPLQVHQGYIQVGSNEEWGGTLLTLAPRAEMLTYDPQARHPYPPSNPSVASSTTTDVIELYDEDMQELDQIARQKLAQLQEAIDHAKTPSDQEAAKRRYELHERSYRQENILR